MSRCEPNCHHDFLFENWDNLAPDFDHVSSGQNSVSLLDVSLERYLAPSR